MITFFLTTFCLDHLRFILHFHKQVKDKFSQKFEDSSDIHPQTYWILKNYVTLSICLNVDTSMKVSTVFILLLLLLL